MCTNDQCLGKQPPLMKPIEPDPLKKLGKAPPRLDKRTLRLAKYLKPPLPMPPAIKIWSDKLGVLGQMLNDKLGICTCAAAAHMVQTWSVNVGAEKIIPDADILAAYQAESGYDPANPETDRGAIALEVLNYWRNVGIGGDKIVAYAALNFRNALQLKQAICLFGGAYIGVNLPLSAQNQDTWDYVEDPGDGSSTPGGWGGHAVPIVAYSPTGLTCITWGKLLTMTWKFWQNYCDESYTILSHDWVNAQNISPDGVDFYALQADLTKVTA